jgi:serine phosphatase RsbU (regulator of sigma subunit)
MRLFGRDHDEAPPRTTQPATAPLLRTANLAAAYRSERIGGDFFDFAKAGDGRVLFAIFDIAGRREHTDVRAVAVQHILRERGPALVAETGNLNDALTELALALNRGILASAGGVHNTPAFLAGFDEAIGMMSYINAGHTPALLSDEDGTSKLAAGGIPLGLFSHVVHDTRTVVLRPGATVLVVSKGIVEAKSGSHEEFGIDRACQLLAERNFNSAQDLCQRVLDEVKRFTATPSFWGPRLAFAGFHEDDDPNDMTALALMRPAVGSTFSAKAS